MISTTDRIEKQVILRAPQERVWRAISDAGEFGSWFGMEFEGAFAPGREIRGRIVPTKADPDVAKMQERHAGLPVTLRIERIEPMLTFSYRWHPFAIDPAVDYSAEPMTLVTFTLAPVDGGTLLTIVETGFDAIPIARRADAFEANDEGWTLMSNVIEKHLALHP
jgi:uncharacterized protein YndB with AHSA1/START domain